MTAHARPQDLAEPGTSHVGAWLSQRGISALCHCILLDDRPKIDWALLLNFARAPQPDVAAGNYAQTAPCGSTFGESTLEQTEENKHVYESHCIRRGL